VKDDFKEQVTSAPKCLLYGEEFKSSKMHFNPFRSIQTHNASRMRTFFCSSRNEQSIFKARSETSLFVADKNYSSFYSQYPLAKCVNLANGEKSDRQIN
jgi:hypothetical protein